MLGIIILIVLPFYYILRKWIIPKKSLKTQIGVTCLFFVAVLFLCGYKIPWFDKYPNLGFLPDHNNKKEIVILKYKELSDFTKGDSLIFPIEKKILDCPNCLLTNKDYQNNLINIKLKGSLVLKNDFSFDNPIANAMKGIGNNGSNNNKPQEKNNWQFPSFYQERLFYYELTIEEKKTIIKGDITDNIETLYQYNKKDKDTLYFVVQNTLYKAYIIK